MRSKNGDSNRDTVHPVKSKQLVFVTLILARIEGGRAAANRFSSFSTELGRNIEWSDTNSTSSVGSCELV
jgi:hypothetical protein